MGRKAYGDRGRVRLQTFAMRLNSDERHMLVALAKKLQRSPSDTVRLLIREALRELTECADTDVASGGTESQRQLEQRPSERDAGSRAGGAASNREERVGYD